MRSIEEALAQEQPAKGQRELSLSSEPVRKSRRLAKKPILDSELDEDYDISNHENLATLEDMEVDTEPENKRGSSSKKNASKKTKIRSKTNEADNDFPSSRSSRDSKKRSRESPDSVDSEEELVSESELDAEDAQQPINEATGNVRNEPLTTRRRALQSWMDGSSVSTVEFPDGLPLAPSRSMCYHLLPCCPQQFDLKSSPSAFLKCI